MIFCEFHGLRAPVIDTPEKDLVVRDVLLSLANQTEIGNCNAKYTDSLSLYFM